MGVCGSTPNEFFTSLDGDLLPFVILRFPRASDIWNLVTRIIENCLRIRTFNDKVCMEEMHDGYHFLVTIWLLFYEDCLGGKNPRSFIEMLSQGDIYTIFVFGWDTRNIPLFHKVRGFIE
jgi:hypothetical protein